jgi:hypothetical protein
MVCCCILAGDTDGGGLAMVIPVDGLMMGMALPRVRVAAGWCSFMLWNEGGMKAGDVELREKAGATDVGCCVGEDSGDMLASDDRSDEHEAIDILCDGRVISLSSEGPFAIDRI